jgi:hypothetical protein
VIPAKGNFDAERNFFKKLAVGADSRNAQVGTAKIDSNGKIGHGGKGYQELRLQWPIVD